MIFFFWNKLSFYNICHFINLVSAINFDKKYRHNIHVVFPIEKRVRMSLFP